MIRPSGVIALAAFLAGFTACFAQNSAPPVTLSDTEQRTITSSKTGSRYDLFISMPEDYKTSNQPYPVLYVLDGWHFPLMAFLQNNNIYSKRMGPVIIVNIGQSPSQRRHDPPRSRLLARTDSPIPEFRWRTRISQFPGTRTHSFY